MLRREHRPGLDAALVIKQRLPCSLPDHRRLSALNSGEKRGSEWDDACPKPHGYRTRVCPSRGPQQPSISIFLNLSCPGFFLGPFSAWGPLLLPSCTQETGSFPWLPDTDLHPCAQADRQDWLRFSPAVGWSEAGTIASGDFSGATMHPDAVIGNQPDSSGGRQAQGHRVTGARPCSARPDLTFQGGSPMVPGMTQSVMRASKGRTTSGSISVNKGGGAALAKDPS
ncbi:uncharacterized protein LOC117285742 [Fukomys damarensis]|uniref:uncharacterized protein LOC117285742 n=1 Tax=Fukomys damarensis TaxID=885580 RepID=UPI001455B211|nr:uncharacterized protein LOC117285742 [Fukomys damarensis]